MKTFRRKAPWLAVVAIGGAFCLFRGSGKQITPPKPLASTPQKPRLPLLTTAQIIAEARSLTSRGAGSTVPASEKSAPADAPKLSLDQALEQVLNEDPVLRRFHDLRQMALRSAAEQNEYQMMLADENLLHEALDELRGGYSNSSVDQGEELRRLQRVQFLNAVVAWKENPARQTALASIGELVLEDVPKTLSKETKGSLLGDKVDLFQHLMLSDPEKAQLLLAQAQGTRNEKLLRLAYATGEQARQPQQ